MAEATTVAGGERCKRMPIARSLLDRRRLSAAPSDSALGECFPNTAQGGMFRPYKRHAAPAH